MGPQLHLYERAREAYYQDLQREMEERRLLALLPRHQHISRRIAGWLGMFLLKLGIWLKRFEQSAPTSADRV